MSLPQGPRHLHPTHQGQCIVLSQEAASPFFLLSVNITNVFCPVTNSDPAESSLLPVSILFCPSSPSGSVKNCEGAEALPFLQAAKLACLSITDAKEGVAPRSETKNCTAHGPAGHEFHVYNRSSCSLVPRGRVTQMETAHTLGLYPNIELRKPQSHKGVCKQFWSTFDPEGEILLLSFALCPQRKT